MRIYQVYDTYDNDLFIMRGTANYIGRKLDVDPKRVRDYCIRGSLIHRRYRIYLENTDDE